MTEFQSETEQLNSLDKLVYERLNWFQKILFKLGLFKITHVAH